MSEKPLLGVDLGGTKVAIAVWSLGGDRLASARWETLPSPRENFRRIEQEGKRLLRSVEPGGGTPQVVGVSAGGPVDPDRGTLEQVPNLPGWRDVPVRGWLAEAFGVEVAIENDANACALAEWRFGAGRGARDLVFLTFSTGIGAGLILAGRLYRGHRHLAGECGHQTIVPDGEPCGCGGRGCLEAYASGAGIARRLGIRRARGERLPATAKELVERAREGDARSREFLHETAELLAIGVANIVFTLNPERVILGTIAVGAGDLLLSPLRQALQRRVWPTLLEGLQVLPAGLGHQLGDHAARAVAMESARRPDS